MVKAVFTEFNTTLPSLAAVERLFSVGEQTETPRRNQLSDSNYSAKRGIAIVCCPFVRLSVCLSVCELCTIVHRAVTTLCLKKGTPMSSIVTLKRINGFQRFFGTNIPDTTGHQIVIQFPTSPNICFYTTEQTKYALKWTINVNKWRLDHIKI